MKIGIDAGGTLIKIAIYENDTFTFRKEKSTDIEKVAQWLKTVPDATVALTGGKATYLNSLIPQDAFQSIEFDATFRGIQSFLDEKDIHLNKFVFSNVGTGTSIHFVDGQSQIRAGGTGAGGGMMLGLSYLLTGISDFHTITEKALEGNRDIIDLKVKHIYKGDKTPIPGELTAANFGNVLHNKDTEQFTDADKIASVLGIVGETVTTVSIHAAREFGAEYVVYIGSSFLENKLLQDIVVNYTKLRNFKPYFIENGEYSGAVGTLRLMEEK
ncbi:type II pantothenate kinase [Macrococcus armenti]|uniref:Type II pantothenate kinase n=1 Tax=Macrococcus armenti TaxID=2875764 RepID=A0ABY3ZTV9_9STAP|nr:type II pantothenate kinase [Macrococcus armenti]UBH08418.1 type II pantothenate kinase [Macrococcus armenti]UBH10704.1 type II pantothenate kinase [Macrococcus armenti]UBH15186.1 type II pantothenate kinase [Macrococcus armenti]UBH17546.1 type II pantothenate kinase [Macrococcus armenti]UBH19812.1 type II pantothenate kinase [Macrococcus armenti]